MERSKPLMKCPIIDCHIHYGDTKLMSGLLELMDQSGIERFNVVCTPHWTRLSLLPDALHLKAHYPKRVYVFGCLDISPLFVSPQQAGMVFAEYVDTLMDLGCDGIKMIEGKPQIRKMLPMPSFDDKVLAPYWERLAEREIPLLFHVNDPEEFWDADHVPEWAVEHGWFYGDGSFIDNEVQYTEVINVLSRHPDLKIIFPHFFFLSRQLERLSGYLDRYRNMYIDITPGIEMYKSFSSSPEEAKDFFVEYQDRILYGTDIGAKNLLLTPDEDFEFEEGNERISLVRRFLETGDTIKLYAGSGFLFGDSVEIKGINLPDSVLEKIYYKNFEGIVGKVPHPLDYEAIVAETERLKAVIEFMAAVRPDEPTDFSVAEKISAFFKSKIQQSDKS